jgi:hypothetical protein
MDYVKKIEPRHEKYLSSKSREKREESIGNPIPLTSAYESILRNILYKHRIFGCICEILFQNILTYFYLFLIISYNRFICTLNQNTTSQIDTLVGLWYKRDQAYSRHNTSLHQAPQKMPIAICDGVFFFPMTGSIFSMISYILRIWWFGILGKYETIVWASLYYWP